MYLFAAQPNHMLPTFNDCNTQPIDPAPTLRFAAEVFGRDDSALGRHVRQGRQRRPTTPRTPGRRPVTT